MAYEQMFARCADGARLSGRLVGPATVLAVEVARGVLRIAFGGTAAGRPDEHRDADNAADDADDAPDRVGESGERQQGVERQVRSTTIVLTEAVTPSATSTTTT